MDHFVTVVLRVPEHAAENLRDWLDRPATGRRQQTLIDREWFHRVGTLPDPNEEAHKRGSSCPCRP